MTEPEQNSVEPALPEVHTQRLRLRTPNDRDDVELTRLLSDWSVAKWLARVPHPYRLADANEFIKDARAKALSNYHFIILLDGELIGGAGLTGETMSVLELGYWVAREHWGRGYATEAAAGLIAFATTDLGCGRLEAGYQKDNLASSRVLRKLGFRPSGEKSVFSLARNCGVINTCVFLVLKH